MAWKQLALGLGAAMLLAACADTKQGQDITVSGFLGDYSILKRGGEGQAAYVYIAPGADASRYDKIWLDAVTVWKDPGQARFKGVPQSDLQMLANAFYSTVHDKLSEDYEMVRGPTPGALRVQIALTDAEASNPGLDTISSIVPQLRLATRLSGLITEKPFFVGATTAEAKLTDAMTGELLGAGIDRRVGGNSVEDSLDSWNDVHAAFRLWAERLSFRLCRGRGDEDCQPPRE